MPFDHFGRLDTARPISARNFLSGDKIHIVPPKKPEEVCFEKTSAETFEMIASTTELAAATLVTLLELEDNAI